jgi:L-glyceraldehyde 3-phosphate reductase
VSNYDPAMTGKAATILRELGTPCLIHQPSYNMFNRWIEKGLLDVLDKQGMGGICFSPLAQGLLTNRYIKGIPDDSRASKAHGFLKPDHVTPEKVDKVRALAAMAQARGQTMAQMSIAWVLRHPQVTSALIGASKVSQVEDIVACTKNLAFSEDELRRIDGILG